MPISGIQSSITPIISEITNAQKAGSSTGTTQAVDQSFNNMLTSLTNSQNTSDNLVEQLSMGGNVDIDQVMIANQENDVNLRVAMAMRDELVNAYREVMRMAV